MIRTGSILEKIARMTRVMRLRRHVQAIADTVGAMSPAELLQLRDFMGSIAATTGGDSNERSVETPSHKRDYVLNALAAMCVERQLNSDSAIVRSRYIARWLIQAIHLSVGEDDPGLRAIYRKAVTIVRNVQAISAAPRLESWFVGNNKKAS